MGRGGGPAGAHGPAVSGPVGGDEKGRDPAVPPFPFRPERPSVAIGRRHRRLLKGMDLHVHMAAGKCSRPCRACLLYLRKYVRYISHVYYVDKDGVYVREHLTVMVENIDDAYVTRGWRKKRW